MSLLLDALKRAAQEKLEKQRQQESAAAESGPVTAEETLSLDITDARAGDGIHDARDLKLDSGTDLRMHRADVLASELQAFMGGNPTEQSANRTRVAAGTPETATRASHPAEASAEMPVPGAATPAAAARLFRNKRSLMHSKRTLLIGGGAAALLLIGIFYTLHFISLNESNVRVDRLLAGATAPLEDTADIRGIEKELLAEQEAIGVLLDEAPAGETAPAAEAATAEEATPTNLFADNPPAQRAQRENDASATPSAVPRLRVRKSSQEPLHDILLRAYNDYQGGDIAAAEAEYRRVLARAPENRDALLGFAATSVRRGDYTAAMESYATLLNLDPNDDLALAGMAGLQQHAQGAPADESQIRRLLLKRPDSAQLHFALGNFYSAAADWPKAQSAYFDAHRYDAQNPDYAYNLAVSLEHLRQPVTALRYYRLALTLAEGRRPNFDTAQAAGRISILEAQPGEAVTDAR